MTKPRLGRRQSVLLVLALLVLGSASERLLGQGQAAVASRRYAIDVKAGGSHTGQPGTSPYPSLRVTYELPVGEEEGVLTVFAGEEARELLGMTVTRGKGQYYCETPLYMEKRRYVLKTASGKSWTAETQCPPLLRGLRAVSAPDRITLRWDKANMPLETWTKEPEIVVYRSDLGKDPKRIWSEGERPKYPRYRELARVQPGVGEFEDRAVLPGQTYVYRVAVVGEVVASLTRLDTGAVETVKHTIRGIAPVHNTLYGVVATAESPKPLRVAVVGVDQSRYGQRAAGCRLATQMVRDALPALPWVLVTVRDAPEEVVSEKTVAGMGQDERGVSAFELVPAEVCLRVAVPKFLVDEVQVWLEDYLNGRHVLLARAPISQPGTLLRQIHEALPRYFPEKAKARVWEQERKGTEKRPRLAVLALRPTSGASIIKLSRASLRSLLAAELASSSRFEVVDREWTDAVFAEQERLALQGEAGMAELGQTLGADYLLSGTYEVQGDELVLEAHLIDVAHGARSNQVTCGGGLDDIGGIAQQLETVLRIPRAFAELSSAIPLRMAFDMDRSLGHTDYRDRVSVAILSRSKDHGEVLMAVDRLAKQDPHGALVLLRRMLRRDDRSDPRRYLGMVCRLDGLLRTAGQAKERVKLWRRATTDVPSNKLWTELGLHVFLSEALSDAGEAEEARKWMPRGPGSIRHVLLYEKLGLRQQAWEECGRAAWLVKGRPGPGYTGAVFLLHGASSAERRMILSEIARRLFGALPYQVSQALLGLERDGPLADDLWGVYLRNAVRLGDETRRRTALANLHRLGDHDRLTSLSRAMSQAAMQGQEEVAKEMMKRIRTMQSQDERTREAQRTLLREGVPEIRAPRAALTVSPAQMERTMNTGPGNGKRVGDTVYLLSDGEVLVAYDPKKEDILWQLDLAPLAPMYESRRRGEQRTVGFHRFSGKIGLGPEVLYVPICRDGRLLAVDRSDGSVRWSYTSWGSISAPTVSADETRVVLADAVGAFVVLDARTGRMLKRIPLRNIVGWARDGLGMVQTRCFALDGDYWNRLSSWVRTAPQNGSYPSLYRYFPGALGGGKRVNLDHRGDARFSHSLNMETLECVEGMPPLPEPKEKLLATLSDRTLPAKQRARRLIAARRVLPMATVAPVLMGIVQNPDEPKRVRDEALRALATHNPSKAVLAMAEMLNAPENRTKSATCPGRLLGETTCPGLDDEAVQGLASLTDHPSPSVRWSAAYGLVWAVGGGSLPYIKSLLADPHPRLGGYDRARMARVMAWKGMPEALVLLRPLLKVTAGRNPYAEGGSNRTLLALARNGNKEALDLVVLPFSQKAHLARLRRAKDPVSAKDLRELEKPYEWIAEHYPMPRFAPFLRESLKLAPVELRTHVLNAYLRVAGEEALPAFIDEAMASVLRKIKGVSDLRTPSLFRNAIEAVTGLDLGGQAAAWEQEINRRARRQNAAGGE